MTNPIDPEKICADLLQEAQGLLQGFGGEVLNWLGIPPLSTTEPQPMNSHLETEQIYADFLNEAQELLQVIEQELLSLREERTLGKVHNLMRAAHTLKGSSASVGLDSLSQIAHGLEGIFKSLYNPDLVIDEELDTLLFQAYEYLCLAVTEVTAPRTHKDPDVLNRAASILADVQIKLGDDFNPDAAIPSSVELGFDVVGSIFEVGVKQRLEELRVALEGGESAVVAQTLQNSSEIFVGLAESLNLPGFGEIARAAEQALQTHPDRAVEIAEIALADFSRSHEAVMGGDRTSGGSPSPELQGMLALEELPAEIAPAGEEEEATAPEDPEIIPREEEETPEPLAEAEEEVWESPFPDDSDPSQEGDFPEWETAIQLPTLGGTLSPIPEAAEATPDLPPEDEGEEVEEEDCVEADPEAVPHPTLDQVFGNFDPATLPDLAPIEPEDEILEAIAEADSSPEQIAEDTPSTAAHPYPLEPTPSPKKSKLLPRTVRVELERLERLNFQAGELLIDQNQQVVHNEQLLGALQSLRTHLQRHQQTLARLRAWGLAPGIAIAGDSSWHSSSSLPHPQPPEEDLSPSSLPSQGGSFKIYPISSPHSPSLPFGETKPHGTFDSLELDQYSELHVLLQSATEEMVQMEEIAEVFELFARQAHQSLGKQQRLLKAVRDDLTQARMQQLGEILGRIERVLHQLSNVYQKQVAFDITGARVLVDKAIAQQLYDPLLHLVRNAFAHGIEEPELRQVRGKPPRGTIDIRAYTQGNYTLIEVSDDGGGINFERIRERAVELDLVGPAEASTLSEAELLEFIFQPRFSTAREANDLFGRGVGLDVVRSNLEALQAKITVTSHWQQGTTFSIRLPLTLSIAKLLVCQAGGSVYALPSDSIEQILLLQSHQVKHLGDRRIIQWQQPPSKQNHGSTGMIHTVPLYRLDTLLKYNSPLVNRGGAEPASAIAGAEDAVPSMPMVMLLRANSGVLGIEVDRVLGEQDLTIRPLGKEISPPSYIDGCSVLGNSRLALAIDLVALVNQTVEGPEATLRRESRASMLALNPADADRPKTSLSPSIGAKSKNGRYALPPSDSSFQGNGLKPNLLPEAEGPAIAGNGASGSEDNSSPTPNWVLVVDDSITLRQHLTRTLERVGYRVLQARDGLEALQLLQRDNGISLIICDLEMPNMNGLEFLNAFRQSPQFPSTPVVILTSRQGEKHRQLAIGLGASAYLTKPYLEHDLLRTVSDYLNPQAVTVIS